MRAAFDTRAAGGRFRERRTPVFDRNARPAPRERTGAPPPREREEGRSYVSKHMRAAFETRAVEFPDCCPCCNGKQTLLPEVRS